MFNVELSFLVFYLRKFSNTALSTQIIFLCGKCCLQSALCNPITIDVPCRSMHCLCDCLLGTRVDYVQTADPIAMKLGGLVRIGPWHIVYVPKFGPNHASKVAGS